MTVRPATAADIPAIVALGRRMHAESPRYSAVPYDKDRAESVVAQRVSTGGMFVADDPRDCTEPGSPAYAIIGMADCWTEEQEATGIVSGCNFVVYVLPQHRGGSTFSDLVFAMEDWAKERGATEFIVGVSTGQANEAIARAYEALGYSPSGISLRKPLTQP